MLLRAGANLRTLRPLLHVARIFRLVFLTALAAVCLFVLKLGLVRTLAVTAGAGFAARTVLGF